MGILADAVNSIYDVLYSATAPGQALAYISRDINFSGKPDGRKGGVIYLVVVLSAADQPEEWSATSNRRQAKVSVDVYIENVDENANNDTNGRPRPYGVSGDTTRRGILTITEDVANAIESARASLIPGSAGKYLDMNITSLVGSRAGDAQQNAHKFYGVVRCEITARFTAGQR